MLSVSPDSPKRWKNQLKGFREKISGKAIAKNKPFEAE